MATNGTVLRFRALYAPAMLWLLGISFLIHLPGSSSVASSTKPSKSGRDSSAYRSYHFVLLVKSKGSNKPDVTAGNVSEELVIMPADAGLLELSNATGGIELKPQPLPGHITSTLVKKYHSNRIARKQAQLVAATALSKRSKNSNTIASTTASLNLLHGTSPGTSKKQRYPKKATPAMVKTKLPKDKVTIHRLNSKLAANLRQLSLPDADLAPYELVATSKNLHGQPRTVRKTSQKPTADNKQQPKPRYEVIGTFRDAHVPQVRTRRQSTTMPKHNSGSSS